MDWKPGTDLYIGLALGFGLVLIGGLVVGMPLRDLVIWAVIFAAVEFIFIQVLKRRNRR